MTNVSDRHEGDSSYNISKKRKLHAYASGSGSLSFVMRDEDRNPDLGRRPQSDECVAYMKAKIESGQASWADGRDWMIINQGPLDVENHEHFEAVRKVERIGPGALKMGGRVYQYDPAQVQEYVVPKFTFELAGRTHEIEGTGNNGALGYFLKNEKSLGDPARVVWDSEEERLQLAKGSVFHIGQKFKFKVGDPIVGNGYRGTVTEVCSGQLDGMVVVGLPGGRACLSSSYPDCYPAVEGDIAVPHLITEGRHVGEVKEVSQQFVTQTAGRGKVVAHEVGRFDQLPNVGESVDIQYQGSKAVVAKSLDKGKGNGR